MLIIRQHQMEALEGYAGHQASERLADFVAEQFLGDPLVRDRLSLIAEINRVRALAVRVCDGTERELKLVLAIRFSFGPQFDSLSWYAAIADDPFGGKLDRLVNEARSMLAQER